jgi:hypothetical protein
MGQRFDPSLPCARRWTTWIRTAVVAGGLVLPGTGTVAAQSAADHKATDDASADDRAAADALFYEAKRLFAAGERAAACAKFEASLRQLDRLGTRLNLANCYETLGRTASASRAFQDAAAIADQRGDSRAAFAHEHADGLAPRLIKLVIVVPPASHLRGLQVMRNGTAVASEIFGTEQAVDPGRYLIEARAPGRQPWSLAVDASGEGRSTGAEGHTTSVAIPELAELPSDARARRHWIGYAVGGVGLVGLGVGATLGIIARHKWHGADEHCMGEICDAAGLQINRDARSLGTTGTIAGGIGLAAIAAGIIIYLTAPAARAAVEHAGVAPLPHAGAMVSWTGAF